MLGAGEFQPGIGGVPQRQTKRSRTGRVLYPRREMKPIASMRRAALLLFAGGSLVLAGGLARGQSPALPATPPTATRSPAAAPGAATAPTAAAVPAQPTAHRAEVTYSGGQLTITADDSSLNQILRDISRLTGMKITGGVEDQHVFGKYGPGAPSGILASLLAGTGSNMLLREGPTHTPVELILTPRNGGPTPPNPNAPGFNDESPSSSDQSSRQPTPPSPQAEAPPQPSAPQRQPASGFFGAPATGPGNAPSASADRTGASIPQSPNGIDTPQQIYQQLQQLQAPPSAR